MEVEELLPEEAIAARIQWVRGQKVMLDADLAELYGLPTFRLNEAVKRNSQRFPEDFTFQLTMEEWSHLTSQFAMSKSRGGRRRPPYAFTEHGVLMSPTRQSRYGDDALSSVLNSERAIAVNIRIMRVFVRMNRLLQNDLELQLRVERMEGRQDRMEEGMGSLFEAVKQLLEGPAEERRRLGFKGGDMI